jgi:hypothetical protein
VTADFAYVRWHGHGKRIWYDYEYNDNQLEEWVPKVEEVEKKAKRTYGYFNNHFNANAVKNAVELLSKLDMATPQQVEALRKIEAHREERLRPAGLQPLEAFAGEEGLSVADLLMRFTDAGRLGRAEAMDEEMRITRSSADLVRAEVKDYYIEVDIAGKVLRHNCDDWRKGMGSKRMCKHVDRLFLSLPPGQSRKILEGIWEERDDWSFEE